MDIFRSNGGRVAFEPISLELSVLSCFALDIDPNELEEAFDIVYREGFDFDRSMSADAFSDMIFEGDSDAILASSF